MDEMDDVQKEVDTPEIVVCDLDGFDWLELSGGTLLVDYRYIMKLQK